MVVLKQKLGIGIINFIKKHCNKLCFLSYLGGALYFLTLAHKGNNDATYFSENALLPGLVQGDFYDDDPIHEFHSAIQQESKASKLSIPAAWLDDEMRKIGLESYVHDYNISYPLGIAEGEIIPGQNVYGIMRAMRTASTESLVLSAPYRPPDNGYRPDNNYAIATMLALAKFARKHSYWAKDIIFLVTDHEAVGMSAWLEAYHQTPSAHIQPAELPARGGSIQAAINLEMSSPKLSSIDMKLEGLNGQLPNLDLFNLAARMCRKEGITPTLKDQDDHHHPESKNGFFHSLRTMIRGMLSQSTGLPSANHGLFHKYHIEALTLSSLNGAPKDARYGTLEMGRILEAIFRSLNNLLERFHQSFFFYVLPATDRYVSIGLYMRPLAMIVVPLVVQAFSLWINAGMIEPIPELKQMYESLSFEAPPKKNDTSETTEKDDTNETTEKDDSPAESDSSPSEPLPTDSTSFAPINVLHVFVTTAFCYSMAMIVYLSPRFFLDMGRVFGVSLSSALLLGNVSLFVPILMLPSFLSTLAQKTAFQSRAPVTSIACVVQGHSHDSQVARGVTTTTCHILKFLTLVLLSLFLLSLSLLNFSLSLFFSLLVVPVALLAQPSSSPPSRFVNAGLVFLVSPPLLYLYAVLLFMFVNNKSLVIASVFQVFQDGLLNVLIESHMYGVQTFAIVILGFLPIWTMLWTVVLSKPKDHGLEINLDHQKKE